MRLPGYPKIFLTLAAGLLLLGSIFTNFVGQDPQSTPAPPLPTRSVLETPPPTRSPTPLPGAQNFHQWGSITLFNGLPSDTVRAIAQTPDGMMWFGTNNGLARFDGRRIQKFSLGESDANRVLVLRTAMTGELWIGTQNGAFIFAENRFQPVAGSHSVGITAILLSDENLLGTDAGHVLRVRAQGDGALAVEKMFPEPVVSADDTPLTISGLVRNEGKLLAGTTRRGVFIVDDGQVSELPSTPRPIFVNALAAGVLGDLWLGTDAAKGSGGIFRVEPGPRVRRIAAATANVLALEITEGGVWAGTGRYGLFYLTDNKVAKSYTFDNTSGGLRSDTIFSLFTDREGVLWIGTNRGVSRFDRLGPFQQTVSDSPNSNFIRTLFRPRKDWSLAGSNRGLFLSEGGPWKPVAGFDSKVIYAIAELPGTGLLIGTSTGLFDFSGKLILTGDIRGLAAFQSRTYAAVFGRGVIGIAPGARGSFDAGYGPPPVIYSDESTTTIASGADRLWIGTADHGLFSFDGRTVKSEAPPDLLKSGTIWKMFSSADGTLWIAGEHGVFRLQNGRIEQIVAAEGVRDVYSRDGQVWAATTTRGLLHARHDDRFGWLVSSIGFEQGMPSEKAFLISPETEALIIATNRGLVTYKPGTVAPKLIAIRVLSQRLHDIAELRSTIALEYPQNALLVEVAGQSSRTFPEEFQYSFLLRNARGEIADSRLSGDPQYTPTDLSPGEYSIESQAFDRDLLASEPLIIRFSIAGPPFPWTASSLAVLLVLSLVALGWAIVAHRRIRERNRELAAARLDLANEAERERRRIARDLHDQTLADLRNLMMMSDKLTGDNAEFRAEVESVSGEIRRICEDLSPSVLENVGLVAALEFLLNSTIENYSFTADEGLEEKLRFSLNVQLQIYRIIQEALTNIKRHSDADLVELSIEMTNGGEVQLTIRDNAAAFEPGGHTAKGRGIANIRARANLINATAEWKQRRKSGNIFSLRVSAQPDTPQTAK